MRRARRWSIAVVVPLLIAGCAASSDVGGESYTGGDFVWTLVYIGAIILAIVGAKILVESHQ